MPPTMSPPPDLAFGAESEPTRPAFGTESGGDDDVARLLPDVAALAAGLDGHDYLTDLGLATALFLAVRLRQPLLLEGEPGVGKTEAAKALARLLDTPLYRLQCYEGIDAAEALYEWDHPRQLLGIRLAEARHDDVAESDLYRSQYLLRRPLLQAIEHPGPRPAVLLLDEIDRADAEFEAFTFQVLAEAAVSIPELGTVRAVHPPVVVLTSNRTRDLHDALTRRCLYHWIDHPATSGGPSPPRPGSAGCGRWTWSSRRASPRRSTGCRRWPCSACAGWTRRRWSRPGERC
jgi:MoxR-like ATPase